MKTCIALLFSLTSLAAFSQVKVIHFNAGWNDANDVEWFNKLSDAGKKYKKNMQLLSYLQSSYLTMVKKLKDFKQILVSKWLQLVKKCKSLLMNL